jgi:hypothetical protein
MQLISKPNPLKKNNLQRRPKRQEEQLKMKYKKEEEAA